MRAARPEYRPENRPTFRRFRLRFFVGDAFKHVGSLVSEKKDYNLSALPNGRDNRSKRIRHSPWTRNTFNSRKTCTHPGHCTQIYTFSPRRKWTIQEHVYTWLTYARFTKWNVMRSLLRFYHVAMQIHIFVKKNAGSQSYSVFCVF